MTTKKPYIPAFLGRAPETPLEALTAAREIIAEEGRWDKGTWFRHDDTSHPEYRENPYCNGWVTCAAGALQLVTVGAQMPEGRPCPIPDCAACAAQRTWSAPGLAIDNPHKDAPPEVRLYHSALRYLTDAVMARNPELSESDRWNAVPNFNDEDKTTHADILAVFRDAEIAAALAEKETAK